jgi:hypothetical protein
MSKSNTLERLGGQSLKISGVSLGFQHFGLAQINFTLGAKDGVCHFQRQGSYEYIISTAGKTRVVLYDTEEKRAWLVHATEAMLHIAQHRNRLNPAEVGGQKVNLPALTAAGPPVSPRVLAGPESARGPDTRSDCSRHISGADARI